ncbi:hypothetical protein [Niallia endozanthoxylica]|uniref:Uncharacterized protein n=1 Tax=Niallia endozanthoxylica TaxID=2036016 RepID=A0A5J5HLE0_9BACI|nr:hypothetical protein [Niallia endozanthoxylica]KAA9021634.1 hypothetical protein F4V44_16735 [Niallia endozanthoxylica]
MKLCNWKNFSTDTEMYTQEAFEGLVGDCFEAMIIKESNDIPSYIWTNNYVVIVKNNSSKFSDISFEKIPRNPISI